VDHVAAEIYKNITNEIAEVISVKGGLNAVSIGGTPNVSNIFCEYANCFAKENGYNTNVTYAGLNDINCLFEYDVIVLNINLEDLNPSLYHSYNSMDYISKMSELDIIKVKILKIINALGEYQCPIVFYSFLYNTYSSKTEEFSYDAFICEVDEFIKFEISIYENFHMFNYNTYILQSLSPNSYSQNQPNNITYLDKENQKSYSRNFL
jgi:hypothetical protein